MDAVEEERKSSSALETVVDNVDKRSEVKDEGEEVEEESLFQETQEHSSEDSPEHTIMEDDDSNEISSTSGDDEEKYEKKNRKKTKKANKAAPSTDKKTKTLSVQEMQKIRFHIANMRKMPKHVRALAGNVFKKSGVPHTVDGWNQLTPQQISVLEIRVGITQILDSLWGMFLRRNNIMYHFPHTTI